MGLPKKGTPEYEAWKNSPDYEKRRKITVEANKKRVITSATKERMRIAHTGSHSALRGRPSPKKGKKVSPEAHASILRAAALRAKPIQEDGLPASLFLPNDNEKECVMCGLIKPLDQFFKLRHGTGGYHPRCRFCYNATYRSGKRKINQPGVNFDTTAEIEKSDIPNGHKQCAKCQEIKSLDQFHRNKTSNDGHKGICKECLRPSSDVIRTQNLRNLYGITPERYDEILQQQSGVCACCDNPETMVLNGKVKPLAIDHCHVTDAIRGLLCSRCNVALGLLCEDPDRIKALLKYVEERCLW
jgi:hypothetical protein